MNLKIFTLASICLFGTLKLQGQMLDSALVLTGYLETYYCYDIGKPPNNARPGFVYSHNRHNEVSLNLGFLKLAYNSKISRANLALMAGTYANENLASEPGILKNILEANLGFSLSKSGRTWVDAGVLPSHIGFETAISKDCWTLTRSLLTEYSPYYETGIQFSHLSKNEKWKWALLYLNGWQHIKRMVGNSTPDFGHQIVFKPNKNILLNSSSFVGTDSPDSTRKMRYFHNFYGVFQVAKLTQLMVGLDAGIEQVSKNSQRYNFWYSPVLVVKQTINDKWSAAARAEIFNDKNQVIIPSKSPNGFQTTGYSINIDFHIKPNSTFRIEGRYLQSKDPIFQYLKHSDVTNYFVTSSFEISF